MSAFRVLLMLLVLATCVVKSLAINFKLHGINYSLRIGADWYAYQDRCKSYDQAVADLTQLKQITNNIRIFSLTDCNSGEILLRATKHVGGLGLWLGMWIGEDGANFDAERTRLLSLLQTEDFSFVKGLHVSSEAIYRGDLTVAEAIAYRNTIRSDMSSLPNVPVVIADIIDNYIAYSNQLVPLDSVVHFNQFPFWEQSTSINNAATYMRNRINGLNTGGRPIVIGETGWADAGSNSAANPANAPSMRKWLRDFVCLAEENNWQYYWFIAYDSDWQRVNEQDPNGVEGHFGIYDEDGNMKPFFRDFSIDCALSARTIDPNSNVFPPTPSPVVSETSLPTKAPSAPPVTSAPTEAPTSANELTKTPTSAPTKKPSLTTAAPSTHAPSKAPTVPTDEPTKTPASTLAPTTIPPTMLSLGPSTFPTDESPVKSNQCTDHSACADLQLLGQCCPTLDNWTLACCDQEASGTDSGSNDGPPSDQCIAHTQCNALNLAGACCPTIDNVYLDCCEVVPNDCFDEGSCLVRSALAYMEEQQSAAATQTFGIAILLALGTLGSMI
mmetsp:Transcript_17786/g.35794  ORF Transcript_17786/g.35794 Transcript_17786/m.35794 type:complete len:556 (+) Transcript_17786:129-1796(+)